MFKKAFTLAEILIVLTVIGILTAILMPIAIQSAPDENILKFKKANATLGTVIRELVNSDRYYLDGDLGTKPDGSKATSSQSYFCKTLAEVLNTKNTNCIVTNENAINSAVLLNNQDWNVGNGAQITQETINGAKTSADTWCKKAQDYDISSITVTDGTIIYETKSYVAFGSNMPSLCNGRCFANPNETPTQYDANGFDIAYKLVCIDIDGINTGEDPFGYGIRADGKILTGARADEWIEKSIQRGDE